jgi:ferredoxin-NADP reductase
MRSERSWMTAVARQISNAVKSVRVFDLEPSQGVVPYALGSHIDVEVCLDGHDAVRSYSLVGEGPVAGAYRIAVKRVPQSRGGSRYMWSLKEGATLRISEPASHFTLRTGSREYLLVAGGIGITPLIGMAESLARRAVPFRLLYAGRAREHMAFLTELEQRLGERLVVFADGEGAGLDLASEIRRLHVDGEIYVCGPVGLMESVRRAWLSAGRPLDRFRIETFGSSGHRDAEPFEVSVLDYGQTIAVAGHQSLLDVLTASGIDVPGHCKRGECGLCVVGVLDIDGEIDHRDVFLSDEQKAEGQLLCPCVSRAIGRISIDTGHRSAL